MNNKGFAITSIIYGLMLLFVMIITSFLSVLVGRNRRMDELILGVYESLQNPIYNEVDLSIEGNGAYIVTEKGKYNIKYKNYSNNIKYCITYLPKNVIVINPNIIEDTGFFFENPYSLYYTIVDSEGDDTSQEDYSVLTCVK